MEIRSLKHLLAWTPMPQWGSAWSVSSRKCSINFREWYIKICHINYNLHGCCMSNNEHTCRTHTYTQTASRTEKRHDPNCLWVLSRAKRCQALIVRTTATATSQFACQERERMTQTTGKTTVRERQRAHLGFWAISRAANSIGSLTNPQNGARA